MPIQWRYTCAIGAKIVVVESIPSKSALSDRVGGETTGAKSYTDLQFSLQTKILFKRIQFTCVDIHCWLFTSVKTK